MTELATRAAACKHWRWMPGMRVIYKADGICRFRLLWDYETCMYMSIEDGPFEEARPMTWIRKKHYSVTRDCMPDFDDPATLGCLLALVRQAYGCMMYVRWWDNPQPDMSGQSRARCEVVDTLGRNRLAGARAYYSSEAEALVAALEAAP